MKKGFTLMEVVVSLTVVAIFASIIFPSYRRINDRVNLLNSAHTMVQEMRRAQEMALSSAEVNGNPQEGYGVRFDKSGPNDRYAVYVRSGLSETDIRTVELQGRVVVRDVFCDGDNTSDTLVVEFEPPDPITTIESFFVANCSEGMINLGYLESSQNLNVKVNGGGLIYVDE